MKAVSSRLRCFVLLVAALPFLVACSKEERVEAKEKAKEIYTDTKEKAKEMYSDTKDKTKELYEKSRTAVAERWAKLKAYTYEKREEFASSSKQLEAEMEAQASKLRSDLAREKASDSRKAALEELKNAEADYKQKAAALGSATAATWDSAKSRLEAAWDKWEVSYRKALAEKETKETK
ncbi:MAG: hypothetical protein JNL92_01645 [Opitutaceae bacterium]|nr:hypothetical protein [Opitutaceae bacterium]